MKFGVEYIGFSRKPTTAGVVIWHSREVV